MQATLSIDRHQRLPESEIFSLRKKVAGIYSKGVDNRDLVLIMRIPLLSGDVGELNTKAPR